MDDEGAEDEHLRHQQEEHQTVVERHNGLRGDIHTTRAFVCVGVGLCRVGGGPREKLVCNKQEEGVMIVQKAKEDYASI